MRAYGNGNPEICAANLLRTTRGEVPYERIKGLNPRHLDRPIITATPDIQQDAEWVLETYEPRVEVLGIHVQPDAAISGGFRVTAETKEKEG